MAIATKITAATGLIHNGMATPSTVMVMPNRKRTSWPMAVSINKILTTSDAGRFIAVPPPILGYNLPEFNQR
jgi:hypothetical protein